VPKFEDLGRKLDRELEKLREVAEKKISPATRNKAAKSLRTVSDTLSRIAQDLDPQSQPPQSRKEEQ
jgi:vacuolar-type H+-ATPase subunit H